MNDLQLYAYYKSIPLATIIQHSWLYPKYVVITGRSICYPHPHRYFTLEEFLDKIEGDKEFYEKLQNAK